MRIRQFVVCINGIFNQVKIVIVIISFLIFVIIITIHPGLQKEVYQKWGEIVLSNLD